MFLPFLIVDRSDIGQKDISLVDRRQILPQITNLERLPGIDQRNRNRLTESRETLHIPKKKIEEKIER